MRLIIQLTHTHHGVDPSHILHNTHCCCSVCNYAARGSCKTQRSAAAALTILIVLYHGGRPCIKQEGGTALYRPLVSVLYR